MKAVSYELVKELLERLKVLLKLHDSRVDIADAWNISVEEARSTIGKVEAEMVEEKPDADGWIKWKGGKCPLPNGTIVDVRFGYGGEILSRIWPVELYRWSWSCYGDSHDIVAYRIVGDA